MNETQVNEAQANGTHVDPVDGAANGSQEIANLKDILGPVFGTQFKSDEDAMKSVEHAKNMAGKVGQLEKQLADLQGTPTMNPELEKKVQELETAVKQQGFYNLNPEFNTPEAKALIADMGGDPETVVQKDSFKTAFNAIKASNEMEKSKSVLHSNPRLGIAQDNMTKAMEARQSGNLDQAAAFGMKAVMEAYPDLKS